MIKTVTVHQESPRDETGNIGPRIPPTPTSKTLLRRSQKYKNSEKCTCDRLLFKNSLFFSIFMQKTALKVNKRLVSRTKIIKHVF